ncbi:MAG: hypothetical protein DBX61_09290 [Clostridiales bacterium]|nr:MAG: hypothetical protein DBX61_09290 [Clostridiales bacterium]
MSEQIFNFVTFFIAFYLFLSLFAVQSWVTHTAPSLFIILGNKLSMKHDVWTSIFEHFVKKTYSCGKWWKI